MNFMQKINAGHYEVDAGYYTKSRSWNENLNIADTWAWNWPKSVAWNVVWYWSMSWAKGKFWSLGSVL